MTRMIQVNVALAVWPEGNAWPSPCSMSIPSAGGVRARPNLIAYPMKKIVASPAQMAISGRNQRHLYAIQRPTANRTGSVCWRCPPTFETSSSAKSSHPSGTCGSTYSCTDQSQATKGPLTSTCQVMRASAITASRPLQTAVAHQGLSSGWGSGAGGALLRRIRRRLESGVDADEFIPARLPARSSRRGRHLVMQPQHRQRGVGPVEPLSALPRGDPGHARGALGQVEYGSGQCGWLRCCPGA